MRSVYWLEYSNVIWVYAQHWSIFSKRRRKGEVWGVSYMLHTWTIYEGITLSHLCRGESATAERKYKKSKSSAFKGYQAVSCAEGWWLWTRGSPYRKSNRGYEWLVCGSILLWGQRAAWSGHHNTHSGIRLSWWQQYRGGSAEEYHLQCSILFICSAYCRAVWTEQASPVYAYQAGYRLSSLGDRMRGGAYYRGLQRSADIIWTATATDYRHLHTFFNCRQ